MGERTFGALFAPYLPADDALGVLTAGEIENMEMHHDSRRLTVVVRFDAFVSAEPLFAAETALARAFGLQSVSVYPRFPADALTQDSFPSLVAYLKRQNVAVNGTFADAQFALEGDTLRVTFSHGGVNILRTTKADVQLKALIFEQYGRHVALEFVGEDTPQNDERYQEMMRQADEEAAARAREQAAARAAVAAAAPKPAAEVLLRVSL
jgi:hypothetical protein